MGNLGNFNAAEIEPSQAMEIMPDHWATAIITESEMKPTAAGDGQRLNLTFSIVQGQQFANRKAWVGLNLVNPNEKSVEISRADLSAICRACNKLTISDSSELHNIPLDIKIGTQKAQYRKDAQTGLVAKDPQGNDIVEYEAKNEVKGYAPAGTKASPNGGVGGSMPSGNAQPSSMPTQGMASMPAQQAQQVQQPATMGQMPAQQVQQPVQQVQQPVETQVQQPVQTQATQQATAVDNNAPAWSQPAN